MTLTKSIILILALALPLSLLAHKGGSNILKRPNPAKTAMLKTQGGWTSIDPMTIRKGDIFKLYDKEGQSIRDFFGCDVFVAIKDAKETKTYVENDCAKQLEG